MHDQRIAIKGTNRNGDSFLPYSQVEGLRNEKDAEERLELKKEAHEWI